MAGIDNKKISNLLLITANILVAIIVIWEGWSLGSILLIYWSQSVIIGFFHFFRILLFKGSILPEVVNSAGHRVNDRLSDKNVVATYGGNIFIAIFFAVHYGLFHSGYLTFLQFFLGTSFYQTFLVIWPAIAIFTVNHFLSLILNWSEGESGSTSLMELFKEPYARIMPMHLIIMIYVFLLANNTFFSAITAGGEVVSTVRLIQVLGITIFFILKIIADVAGHNNKHQSVV